MRNVFPHSFTALLILTVTLAVPAVGRAESPVAPAATRPAASTDRQSWSGEWQTSFGLMRLTQNGDTIEGTYAMGGPVSRITGKLDPKGRFTFTYTEPSAAGEGWFELTANGAGFTGQWREKGAKDWAAWSGKRAGGGVAAVDKDSFTGLWETSYGRMRLRQTEKTVEGIYAFAGRSTVTGTVEGRKLTYKYDQPDGEKGTATVELAADGQSFTGAWKGEKQAQSGGGKWEGRRVAPQPGRVWLIVLEAPWEHALVENEYSFGLMLRTFFARVPNVQVRHRLLNSESDFKRWTNDLPYLAEPVVLYISSHGTQAGITVGGKTIGPKEIADGIRDADSLMLLHFGSCLVCGGPAPKQIHKELGSRAKFPISGFTKVADWAGSAVVDFTYLDLMFSRGMSPPDAVRQTRKMLTFAADGARNGEVIAPVGLVVFEP